MKLLVCGTRGMFEGYKEKVYEVLDSYSNSIYNAKVNFEIIEGCCPNSADEYAEDWAKEHEVKVNHFPSNSGNYLKRNIEMLEECDEVLAFWDGWSYGTAHTIANALLMGIDEPYPKIIILNRSAKNG